MEAIFEFLHRESQWMIPKLFNGADPEMVAHELTREFHRLWTLNIIVLHLQAARLVDEMHALAVDRLGGCINSWRGW